MESRSRSRAGSGTLRKETESLTLRRRFEFPTEEVLQKVLKGFRERGGTHEDRTKNSGILGHEPKTSDVVSSGSTPPGSKKLSSFTPRLSSVRVPVVRLGLDPDRGSTGRSQGDIRSVVGESLGRSGRNEGRSFRGRTPHVNKEVFPGRS